MENSAKPTVNPYLAFNGNCKEAMTFYHEALGGELFVKAFGDGPMEIPDEHKDKIMYASLQFGDAIIMASDTMPEHPAEQGSAVSISIASRDLKEAERFFSKLAEGGRITMPFEPAFWGATFGMLTDKFGIKWMVKCETQEVEAE